MTVWLTSDLHVRHRFVSRLRGYSGHSGEPTLDDHDAMILGNIRATVSAGDELWILGDLSGRSSDEPEALDRFLRFRREEIPGVTVHLIPGNHDSVHPYRLEAHRSFRDLPWLEAFDSIQAFARWEVAGRTVWLSHFPWRGTPDFHADEERFREIRFVDEGDAWLIYGHTHTSDPWQYPRSVNVGVEGWNYRPVRWDYLGREIVRRMEGERAADMGDRMDKENTADKE